MRLPQQNTILMTGFILIVLPMGVSSGFAGIAHGQTDAGPIDVDVSDLPGEGTESNPYEISNVSELQAMEDDLDANYSLINDIDASQTARSDDGHGFDPTGGDPSNEGTPSPFTGSFDGNSYTITGLTINRPTESEVGLFGRNSGTVTDITLTEVTVIGDVFVGGLVGYNNGTIRNTTVSGSTDGANLITELIGQNNGNVMTARASGSVTGNNTVGGLAGTNYGTVRDASASGSVTGDVSVGGLVGQNFEGTIRNATASGNVIGTFDNVGGLVGRNGRFNSNGGTIRDVTASGDVQGTDLVGGIVGQNNGNLTTARASGDVDGTNLVGGLAGQNNENLTTARASGSVAGDLDIGGLVGDNSDGTIRNGISSGSVTGDNGVGGLVGQNFEGQIRNATASGNVDGNGRNVGGLVGDNNDGTVRNATASGRVTGGIFVGGLVGNNKDGIILGASASGSVTGDNSVGGLVGVNGVIKNTFAVGPVTGNRNVGGLIGLTESGRGSELVESSYFDTQTTGQDTSASPAIGLTTSEMQGDAAIENMPGLEFGEIWRTVSGDYPKLVASSNSDAGGGSESPTSVVEEFDEDGNDNIEITELGQAAQALASGELTFSEFGQIGVEFIM